MKRELWKFIGLLLRQSFLPPAYVVRREGTVFTGVCLLTFVGVGYPSQVWMVGGTPFLGWGVPWPGLEGGTPSLGWGGGTWPGLDGGGIPLSQAWMVGGIPWPGLDGGGTWGYPLARHGWWGVPQPGLDGGGLPSPSPARSGWWGGTPARSVCWEGYPPGQVWMVGGYPRYPPHPPIRQSSIASTCYVAGSMPLAFTQEDFLVLLKFTRAQIPCPHRLHPDQ